MNSGDVFSIILPLLGTIGVIVLTYYGSRWYVKKVVKGQGSFLNTKHIKIIERLGVSKNGSIIIIEVQGKQYMVGVSEENIQIMKELEEPIIISKKLEKNKESFLSVLKKATQKEKKNENK